MRIKYGTERWTRTPSEEAAKALQEQGDRLGAFLKKAEDSDGMVRSKLLEWEDVITLLSGEKVQQTSVRYLHLRTKLRHMFRVLNAQNCRQKVPRRVKESENLSTTSLARKPAVAE